MRRLFTICLIAAFSALPAIDAVYCPDGCTDTNEPPCAWQAGVSPAIWACGLCVNAVALHCAVTSVQSVERVAALGAAAAVDLVSIAPRAFDRPPRRS